MFKIYLTDEAQKQFDALKEDKGPAKRYKAVQNFVFTEGQSPPSRFTDTRIYPSFTNNRHKNI